MENLFKEDFVKYLKSKKSEYNHFFFTRSAELKKTVDFKAYVDIFGGQNNLFIIKRIRLSFNKKEIGELFDSFYKQLLDIDNIDFDIASKAMENIYRIGQQNGLYPFGHELPLSQKPESLLSVNDEKQVNNNHSQDKLSYKYELLNFTTLRYNLFKTNEKQEKIDKNIDIELSIVNENGVLKPAISFQWFFIKNTYREYTIPIYKGANYIVEEINNSRKIIQLQDFEQHLETLTLKMLHGFCSKYIEDIPNQSTFLKLTKQDQLEYAYIMKAMSY